LKRAARSQHTRMAPGCVMILAYRVLTTAANECRPLKSLDVFRDQSRSSEIF
jgi:hypothetical protein